VLKILLRPSTIYPHFDALITGEIGFLLAVVSHNGTLAGASGGNGEALGKEWRLGETSVRMIVVQ